MPEKSTNKNKSIYKDIREKLGYSRAKVEELTNNEISEDRLVKTENGTLNFYPKEIVTLSKIYNKPDLRNHYCTHDCDIGKDYMPKVEIKNLSQIILEMISSLNHVQKSKDRLIDIVADGEISYEEIEDFYNIKKELERISITTETLELWTEKMLASGKIDKQKYKEIKDRHEKEKECYGK